MIPISSLITPAAPLAQETFVHGLQYYAWRGRIILDPDDKLEGGRLDVLHTLIYTIALHGRPFISHLSVPPEHLRVLDVGFGTGSWIYEISERYPQATVVGIDVHGYRADRTEAFPNVDLRCPVDFHDDEWGVPRESFDLIHMGQLSGDVSDWEALYRRASRYLKPGTGRIELVEIDWKPRCFDNQNFPTNAQAIVDWYDDLVTATRRLGVPIEYCEDTGDLLHRAGYTDVSQTTIQVPFSEDNSHGDPYLYDLAFWLRGAMGNYEYHPYQCLSMYPLTHVLQYSPERVHRICSQVDKVLNRSRIPLYYNLHIWTARKPHS